MSEKNKAMVWRLVEGINAGDIEATVDELFAPRAARRVKRLFTEFYTAFPDWRQEIVESVAEGNTVAGRFECSGTHRGEFLGEPPTGKRMEVEEAFSCAWKTGSSWTSGRWRTALGGCGNSGCFPRVAAGQLRLTLPRRQSASQLRRSSFLVLRDWVNRRVSFPAPPRKVFAYSGA
jgi:SnoaL-like polyketide cyclase